ncbi:two-component system heavy metal sensor histidine kinase CusS [Oxalobacteraceae bacterium GrIS 1.11]
MKRKPLSLALRLALLFSAVAACTLAVVGAYLYHTLAQQMADRDDVELLAKVALIRHILAESDSLEQVARTPQRLLDSVFGGQQFMLRVDGPDGKALLQNALASRPLPPTASVPSEREPGLADVRDWQPASGHGRLLRAMARIGGHGAAVRITLARERSDRLNILKRYAVDLLLALCGGAALASTLGWLIARHAMRPLRSVIGKANAISANRLEDRLAVQDAPAELRELGLAFNAMLERLEDGVRRLSSFAADLAHDLRTPLNALMMETQVALARPRGVEEYQCLLVSNLEEYERLARMVENTLFLARADNAELSLRRARLDAGAELLRIRDYFEGLAEEAGVALTAQAEHDIGLQADPILLQRAVGNLVSNAIDHTPAGGAVRLSARRDAHGVTLAVSNSGPGIAADHLPHIFERYYRADPARSTTPHAAGLGLAIVRAIMRLHGGSVAVRSVPGQITTFELRFETLP